jgi:flavin reductase (DIM6/NTAB) family NADH-FMN oxidoreductase RutF
MTHTVFKADDLPGRDGYKLLTGLVVPRPIAWVGTIGENGVANVAPFSFFNVAASKPPTLMICPGATKDTLANIRATREFTVSVVSMATAEAMNATSASLSADEDEFVHARVTPVTGQFVAAPWVAESPAAMECILHSIIDFESGSAVLGTVVAFHVRSDLLDGTRVDPGALDAVGRLAGYGYSTTRDRFEMVRPD